MSAIRLQGGLDVHDPDGPVPEAHVAALVVLPDVPAMASASPRQALKVSSTCSNCACPPGQLLQNHQTGIAAAADDVVGLVQGGG